MSALWSQIGAALAERLAPPRRPLEPELEHRVEAALGEHLDALRELGSTAVAADLLPASMADAMHAVALDRCTLVSPTKELRLLHASRNTTHFFECDAFLALPSEGRRVATAAAAVLAGQLDVDHLACAIQPVGLAGTHPLCYALALARDLTVLAAMPVGSEVRIAGRIAPSPGRALIVSDVLTTGTTVARLAERLRGMGIEVVGALLVYDRLEGGGDALAEAGVPYAALMSRRSLREYAERRLRDPRVDDDGGRARAFLVASRWLAVKEIDAASEPRGLVRAAVAASATPPLSWFDERLRLRPEHREEQRRRVRDAIEEAHAAGASLIAFPELTIPLDMRDELAAASAARDVVIVGGAEYSEVPQNLGLIAFGGRVVEQAKTLRSPYDLPSLHTGDRAYVVRGTRVGDVAVVVCADHASYELMDLLRHRVQLLVVVARNRAVATFASMAAGDAYRVSSFVLTVNDPEVGECYLASPRKGPAKLELLGRPRDGLRYVDLDLAGLVERGPAFLRELEY